MITTASASGMKQAQRDTITSADLNDAEMALIEAGEIPPEHRYHLDIPERNDGASKAATPRT